MDSSFWTKYKKFIVPATTTTIVGAVAASTTVLMYFGNYFLYEVAKPEVYHNPLCEWSANIVKQSRLLNQHYWPTFWAYNQHLSTIITQLRSSPKLEYTRELLDLPDGGILGVDWLESKDKEAPILICVPGLSGSSKSEYIQHIAQLALKNGWRVAVMNYRGTNGVPLKSCVAYSAGWTEDLRFVCNAIARRYPSCLKIGIGYSLGSNILVKCMCEDGEQVVLDCGISVSNPYDLRTSSSFLERTIYSRVLAHGAIQTFKEHQEQFSKWRDDLDHHRITTAKSIKDYDEHLTSKLFGFGSADDYYSDAGCTQYLSGKHPHVPGLRKPVIFISARDDPLIPEAALPIQLCQNQLQSLLIVSKRGGHVGFGEGLWPTGINWSDRIIMELLEIIRNNHVVKLKNTKKNDQ